MLKIRLQRTGGTNDPSFRIVVVEHTESTKTGNIVERVGTYNPKTKEKNIIAERILYWLSKGAKASGTVHNMLVTAGIVKGKKVNVLPQKSPPKSDQDKAAAGANEGSTAAQAPAAESAAEAATEEAPKAEAQVQAA